MKRKHFFNLIRALFIAVLALTQTYAQKNNVVVLPAIEEQYACSMHSEFTSTKPGKCAKCGMSLVKVSGALTEEFIIKTETLPAHLKPAQTSSIRLTVFNPRTLERVTQFNIQHEKLFHLFIVSHDLKFFSHIHPEQQSDGSFIVSAKFPQAGLYHVYSDIFPVGGLPQVIHQTLVTTGFSAHRNTLNANLLPDEVFEKKVGGVKINLATAPTKIVAGSPTLLRYQLTDEKTGKPIADLEQYLGAWGHVLILREDCSDFIHSHPLEVVKEGQQAPTAIYFETEFSQPGKHRIWVQFQRAGKIITASFDVSVLAPE